MKSLVILLTLLMCSISLTNAQDQNIIRENLISDVRQLSDILENVHPDPYINGGGKIAYHRRLQGVLGDIPVSGMTKGEFYQLIAPFVSALGDAHTRLTPNSGNSGPGGLPFGFCLIEKSFYVKSVRGEQYTDILGALLESIEGTKFPELIERYRKYYGTQNEYNLIDNLRFPIWNGGDELSLLIPEWKDKSKIQCKFKFPDGKIREYIIPQPLEQGVPGYITDTKFNGPSTRKSDFAYNFTDDSKEIAVLAVTGMSNYREALERRDELGLSLEANERRARRIYKRYYGEDPPVEMAYEELRSKVPSATELFLSLVKEMKDAETRLLLVDLRGNIGGSSAMSTILTYFLFGTEQIIDNHEPSIEIKKYSQYYFETHDKVTLETLNADRKIPITENDYIFSRLEEVLPEQSRDSLRAALKERLNKSMPGMPTFNKIFVTGEYEAYYRPEKIVVLCNVQTFSSGYTMMYSLYRGGAILVGTPSGQAANVFGSMMNFTLDNSGLSGYVSQMRFESTALDDETGRVIMPQHLMTYERLVSYDFDRNAEILWALELYGKK